VYNGRNKLMAINEHFMSEQNILEAVASLKLKNCEGYDRIPQRILIDGLHTLEKPLSTLFDKIYNSKDIPEQWLFGKVMPVYKKDEKMNVENFRPIANLCSTSKIFEKLILQRIIHLEEIHKINITHISQHGFKRKQYSWPFYPINNCQSLG
jgi:hypothetical protein